MGGWVLVFCVRDVPFWYSRQDSKLQDLGSAPVRLPIAQHLHIL